MELAQFGRQAGWQGPSSSSSSFSSSSSSSVRHRRCRRRRRRRRRCCCCCCCFCSSLLSSSTAIVLHKPNARQRGHQPPWITAGHLHFLCNFVNPTSPRRTASSSFSSFTSSSSSSSIIVRYEYPHAIGIGHSFINVFYQLSARMCNGNKNVVALSRRLPNHTSNANDYCALLKPFETMPWVLFFMTTVLCK